MKTYTYSVWFVPKAIYFFKDQLRNWHTTTCRWFFCAI